MEILPSEINLSEDSSVPTTIRFKAPIYLEPKKEYAIVLLSHSNNYNVWISRMGEIDVSTLQNEKNKILVSSQPVLGSLLKSQNTSTWTPSQYEDLKFELYRADFNLFGFTQLFNQKPSAFLEISRKDPLTIESNKVRISISSTITSSDFDFGTTVIQDQSGISSAVGTVIGYGGSATSSLNVVSAGVGYTPSSGIHTYTNISLVTQSGNGSNATADITVNNGKISSAVIVSGGSGYVVGDLLKPSALSTNNVGIGALLGVSAVIDKKELILDNVQGTFEESNSYPLKYINSSQNKVLINGSNVYINSPVTVESDGKHIKVFHRNHGMYSKINKVNISGVIGDVLPVTLTSSYSPTSSDPLPVSDTTNFETFENAPVTTLNPGYIKVGQEIMKYTGYTSTTLTGIERSVDGTKAYTHDTDYLVEKYELGGISLRRINTEHDLRDIESYIQNPIGVDYYYIKIDTGSNTGLKFNTTKPNVGGTGVKLSYNTVFNAIKPSLGTISPSGTSIKYQFNSVTGTSPGGNQTPYLQATAQSIELIFYRSS
jgi:hypothetical protein